jgi:hypothetical protein
MGGLFNFTIQVTSARGKPRFLLDEITSPKIGVSTKNEAERNISLILTAEVVRIRHYFKVLLLFGGYNETIYTDEGTFAIVCFFGFWTKNFR